MPRRLMPLRIPSGYAVVFNIFVEFPEGEPVSAADAESFLSSDILSIEQIRFDGAAWRTDQEGVLVDLSWSAPGDTAGEYVLAVMQGGWEGPRATFRDRNGDRVRRAIDMAFHVLLDGPGLSRLEDAWKTLD